MEVWTRIGKHVFVHYIWGVPENKTTKMAILMEGLDDKHDELGYKIVWRIYIWVFFYMHFLGWHPSVGPPRKLVYNLHGPINQWRFSQPMGSRAAH